MIAQQPECFYGLCAGALSGVQGTGQWATRGTQGRGEGRRFVVDTGAI